MKTLVVLAAVLLVNCTVREYKVVKVESSECVKQCAHSFWKSSFDHEKYTACKDLYDKKPCCVYETMNQCSGIFCDGQPWSKGYRGQMVACATP